MLFATALWGEKKVLEAYLVENYCDEKPIPQSCLSHFKTRDAAGYSRCGTIQKRFAQTTSMAQMTELIN